MQEPRRGAAAAVAVLLGIGVAGCVDASLADSDPDQPLTEDTSEHPPSTEPQPADQPLTENTTEHPPSTEPQPAADRTLAGEVELPEGFTVPAGEVWELDPHETTTVTSEANVIVEGVLRMQPSGPDITHTLRFDQVDESLFVGASEPDGESHDDGDHAHTATSADDVPPTDVGLWVLGEGQLVLEGSERAGWNRTGEDPSWQPDDEIRLAPTDAGDTATFAGFEPGSPVPEVAYAGRTYTSEVFNLTRNVRIEGSGDGEVDPDTNGRAHILIESSRPQVIRFAELRHLGPRQPADRYTEGVLGRYPLHFHMMGDGARGSLVEGVVVADSGNRAFVPHGSHGITFDDTVAFNIFDDAYWWDPDDTGHGGQATNLTNDLVYNHALAALVRTDPEFRGYTLSGFALGEGDNMTVTDSVAVGVQGNNTASGFHWPATANGNEHNMWAFSGNVAHNNAVSGIFVWQNDGNNHVVEDFVAYRNGSFGVDHGAYANNYVYDGMVLFENEGAGIRSKAASTDRPQQWRNIDTDSILVADRALDSDTPTLFENVTLRGEVVVDESGNGSSGRAVYEFRDVLTADGSALSADDFDVRHQVSNITLGDATGHSLDLDL